MNQNQKLTDDPVKIQGLAFIIVTIISGVLISYFKDNSADLLVLVISSIINYGIGMNSAEINKNE